jgi:hypothetical protein
VGGHIVVAGLPVCPLLCEGTTAMSTEMSKLSGRQARRNTETATHKFPVGAYVLYQAGIRSRKETFRVTRLLPDGGAGFQYRIKGDGDGFERVVTESSLEAIG